MAKDSKGALYSLGVWGGIVAALPAVDALLLALGILPIPVVSEGAGIIISAIGGIASIFGRVRAKKVIKGAL